MERGLRDLLAALDQYSESQLIEPLDTQGWNGRDHLTHLAVWAEGIVALLRRENRWAAMGLAMEEPESEPDYDLLNDAIVGLHRSMSGGEAREWVVRAHHQVSAAMDALADDELGLPYARYVAPFTGDWGEQITEYILGNTEDHYEEHATWIRSIAEGGQPPPG